MAKKRTSINVDLNPIIDPVTKKDDVLRQDVLKGSGDPNSVAYRDDLSNINPAFQVRTENFRRTYASEFFRQSQTILLPSITRDLRSKASKAKTPEDLAKVIKDTVASQTKYLNDLLTNINNAANTLGSTAQRKIDQEFDLRNADPNYQIDTDLIDFYQDRITEIKQVEEELRTYSENAINKLRSQVTRVATTSFKKADAERTKQKQNKENIDNAKILTRYRTQYTKVAKQELESVANRTAFEKAQQFVDEEAAKGSPEREVMTEARRIYDATRNEVIAQTKIESKLSEEEILTRYKSQANQFKPEDFVSEVVSKPDVLSDLRKFEVEFRTGLVKSGQEILNYFTEIGKSVPDSLRKQLEKPDFTAESGTVFAKGITSRNREDVAESLKTTFEEATTPPPYKAATIEKPLAFSDYTARIKPKVLRSVVEYLTSTPQELAARKIARNQQTTSTYTQSSQQQTSQQSNVQQQSSTQPPPNQQSNVQQQQSNTQLPPPPPSPSPNTQPPPQPNNPPPIPTNPPVPPKNPPGVPPLPPPPPGGSGGKGGSPPDFNRGSLQFPGGPGASGGSYDSYINAASRLSLAKSRIGMAIDAAKIVTSVPQELLKGTANATTSQGVSGSEGVAAMSKGTTKMVTSVGSLGGAAMGGLVGSVVPGIGTAAGAVVGGLAGGAVGQASGGSLEIVSLLTSISENTAKSVQAFSPEVLSSRLDNQIKMLELNISTGEKYGKDIAELNQYSNEVRQEMYKLGIDFMIAFKPFTKDMLALAIFLLGVLRSLTTPIYYMYEFAIGVNPLIAPIRLAAVAVSNWLSKPDSTKSLSGATFNKTKSFMRNRPENIQER